MDNRDILMEIFQTLLEHFGPRGWWPGETRLEVMVGAILTQAVAWKNVEKSIQELKAAGMLNLQKLTIIPEAKLAELIKTTLYHNQKAKKIKALMYFINQSYQGNLDLMFTQPLEIIRPELLSVWGIGEETADSILLYAGDYPIFVIDAYTRRIFHRLGLTEAKASYRSLQSFMHSHLSPDVQLYNEYHALLVALGANNCKKSKPQCSNCPLLHYCKKIENRQEKS